MRVRFAGLGPSYGDVTGLVGSALTSLYNRMEVRTAVTPPAIVDLKGALDSSSPPSPVAQFLQPTIILSGPGGTEVIAPYGVAGDGTAGTIGFAMLLMALGYVIGWTARKRKHPSAT